MTFGTFSLFWACICIVLQQKLYVVFRCIYLCFFCDWSIGFMGAIVYLQVFARATGRC